LKSKLASQALHRWFRMLSPDLASSGWEETRTVIQEAIKVFTPANDVEAIRAVKSAIEEKERDRQRELMELKKSIRGRFFCVCDDVDKMLDSNLDVYFFLDRLVQ
jgi:hypothetical protein